ncbi:MAG: ribosome silencing factor [Armatimonadota bacterium]|nr:ribosome silencing factor [Armatimonadota bacterium]MDW8155194.1 ribosome silencing factor [Armatimonadota bacterium]
MGGYDKALVAARAAEEKRAADVVVLDLREYTLVADYFVIATGESVVQLRAIAEAVEEAMEAAGAHLVGREGTPQSRWVLMDYGDVVVHLFGPEERAYYRLERLWGPQRAQPAAPRRVRSRT